MTPRELLDAFDVLAEAPNGIARLRELVLQLAVRGKLVPQDPSDEPAHAWLGKRELLLAQPPFEIPAGWAWSSIEALGELRGGGTPSKSRSTFWGGDIPWVSPKDMKRDRIVSSIDTITEAALGRSPAKRVPRGAILMVVRGMILAHSFPVAVADVDVTLNQDMKALVPFRVGLEDYLLLVLKALKPHFLNAVERSTHGTCKLTTDRLIAVPLPIAPLAEQARIVARVDELMALIDRFEQARSQRESTRIAFRDASLASLRDAKTTEDFESRWSLCQSNFDSLITSAHDVAAVRAAIGALAVRGRLSRRSGSDGTTEDFLTAVLEMEPVKRKRPGREYSADGSPGAGDWSIPSNWTWCRFDQVIINRDAERVPVSSEVREGRRGPYPYYGASGIIDSIDDYLFDETLLLVGEDGANLVLRSTPVAFLASGRYWVNNHAHVLKGVSVDSMLYFAEYINSIDLKPYLTGTAQPKLNQAKMNAIFVAVPPLAEQERIVRFLARATDACDRLQDTLSRTSVLADAIALAVVATFHSPQG